MRLKTLYLENFGPFKEYEVEFPTDSKSCILITGKNNAGKTTIIRSLKLVASALRFVHKTVKPVTKQLFKKDIQDINIDRMIYQFKTNKAIVQATFDNEKTVKITLNSEDGSAICEIPPYSHVSMSKLFGFLPPLGQLVERETLLSRDHLLDYINSTTAPHHLRNHLYHFISPEQFKKIQEIVKDTWEGVELHECEYDIPSGLLTCTYNEGSFFNEIAWSGQGLQIWLQIITHLVRLSEYPILVLDEPEIYLHPKKQHDLIRLLQEHYSGSAILATHSIELMNDIDISHIIHVQKDSTKATIRKTADRSSIDKIRRQVGSSFNLHASQFEDVETLLATEHQLDYDIIQRLATNCGIIMKTQNIKLSGFSHWKDYIHYRGAYYTYFGRNVECSIVLDKDYFPIDYLDSIKVELEKAKVKIAFTPGKEIENLFLEENFLISILPKNTNPNNLCTLLENIYDREYEICKSKYAEFLKDYSEVNKHKTYSTILGEITPNFNKIWKDKSKRHTLIAGKNTLAEVREFFKTQYNLNLTTNYLTDELSSKRDSFVIDFLSKIY
jgi:predicted ATP-dependent endonuclease of OLD family